VPSGLTASAASSTQVTLGWTASTDNVGVTSYLIERCQGAGCGNFVQIGTSTTLSYTDATVSAPTSYRYRVRTTDAAGNLSDYSNTAGVTTPASLPIAFIQGNYATPQSSVASVSLTYLAAQTASNLNVIVVGWNDTKAEVLTVSDTRGNTYVRAVGPTVRSGLGTQSVYYAANIAGAPANTNTVIVTFDMPAQLPDIRIAEYQGIDPVNPVDVVAGAQGSGTTSNSGVATTTNANDLLVGANLVAQSTTGPGAGFTSRFITSPDSDILEDRVVTTEGSYSATASLTGGAWVMQMVAFRAGSVAPDTEAPSAPANLLASSPSSNQISLSWTASTDNVAVTEYRVERCQGMACGSFAQVATVTTNSFADTALTSATDYGYRVLALDAVGNVSGYSNIARATTQISDSEPPSAPGTLAATGVSGTQINLSWLPATDNVGVTGYRIERCQGVGCSVFIKLTVQSGTTFADTGLTPNTSYSYVVLATDGAGNLGPYSNSATAITGTTIPELVAAYSFNEGSGTTAIDTSGKDNHGAIGAATWTGAGKFGGALSFDGSARVIVADSASLHLTSGLTLEAWVNPSNVSSGWRDVVYKGNDNYYLEATTSNGERPAAGVTVVTSGNSNTYGPSVLPLNTWTHLAETYDGATVRLYVNGVQVASTALSGNLVTSTSPLEIGGDGIYGQYFQGLIDEVRVFNVARTPTQIQSDMGTPVGSTVPVVTLSTSTINYGQHAVGTASGVNEVTLTNIGGAALTIASIGLVGPDAGDFAQTNTCSATLAAGTSCVISVTFTPGAVGARSASITVQDDAAGAPHTISLQGVGVSVLVTPGAATLTPGGVQQFTATNSNTTTFIWSVDDVVGGSSASGTISTSGLYTAPQVTGAHVVTATTPDQTQSGNASIFVVSYTGTFTSRNNSARTAANLNETVLTPANVNSTRFGKLQSYSLDGMSFASPLYVPGVTIPGRGVHNVVYVATEHNSVYAFDADGLSAVPLWQKSFINPSQGITTVSPSDVGECCDITPEIGISGTPVIDPATGTLYVVAKTKEGVGGNANFVQRLHALDITTGDEKFGGPVVIRATVPGNGVGSSGGQLTFLPLRHNQRPALLLEGGVVYIAFGSHGDQQPYHGWLFGYNATTLQQTLAYCATANGEGAGIWIAGSGPAADSAGNIYFVTGDGFFDANAGGVNFGDSYVKINPAGTVLDYFTPHNEGTLDGGNIDLGAGGILLLPDQPGAHPHLMVSAGKNGTIDLIDRDNMGHFNPANDNQIVQSLVNIFPFGTPEPGNYSAPVYFNGTLYFSPVEDTIQAFTLSNGLLSTSATSRSAQIYSYPGGTLALSASGTSNGILWALERRSNSPGALRAYDARNLAVELYNSDQAGSRDALDEVVKFSAPLIANGKVYVATATKLWVFGLIQ
jgi:fibronectin type 3 domain-containing protein